MKWLLSRLRTMGPAEIGSRLVDAGRHSLLRYTLQRVQWRAERQPILGRDSAPEVGLMLGLEAAVQQVGRAEREPVMALANQWLSHRASFFGLDNIPLGDAIDWHRDYQTGVIGPLNYSELINYRDPNVAGDVKNIWELNRLQHLVLLSLAGVWSGDTCYEQEVMDQMVSWRDHNPFMHGLNWKSSFEVGMRLISWALVSALLGKREKFQQFCRREMRTTLYEHQYVLRTFFSKHSSANNHLIGEMAGLYVASVFWPWYRESQSWHLFARDMLIQEIMRQVEVDGVGRERATEYQLFITELFLLAGSLGQAIGESFPPDYWDRLRQMVSMLATISDRAGNLPVFGDGDAGQVIGLPGSLTDRQQSIRRLGGRELPGRAEADVTELRRALLLWGQFPEEMPFAPLNASSSPLQTFPQGGYYVLMSGRGAADELIIVADAAPHGMAPLHAHGHADALSFWLSYGGREFLIDPGTFCYYARDDWRSYFRSTAAHNTVRVDGEEQSIAAGRFLWSAVANCQVERVAETDDSVELEAMHDGYRRLADPVTHRRHLCLSKTHPALVLTDRLDCQGSHFIELFFHFSEACQVTSAEAGIFDVSNANKRLRLQIDARLSPTLYHGSEQPMAGWRSRHFGVKEPCFTLVARGKIHGPTQFRACVMAA